MLAVEIWDLVAAHTERSPFAYIKGAHICQRSRRAFFRDAIWRKFALAGCTQNIAHDFCARLETMPRNDVDEYKAMWGSFLESWATQATEQDDDWFYKQMMITETRSLLKRFVNAHTQLLGNSYIAWAHFNSVAWWEMPVRHHSGHVEFVRQAWSKPEFDWKSAILLYGPLLRYASPEMLDDKQLVLGAVAYNLGPTPELDYDDEWTYWRCVVPYKFISDRLKRQRDVTLAFLRRWPFLIDEVPEQLLDDPEVRLFTRD